MISALMYSGDLLPHEVLISAIPLSAHFLDFGPPDRTAAQTARIRPCLNELSLSLAFDTRGAIKST